MLGAAISTWKNYDHAPLIFDGLVLQHTGETIGEYRRVGFFSVDFVDNGMTVWEDFMNSLGGDMGVNADAYVGSPELDAEGNKMYTITLI
jgi:hypothetical protein